MSHQKPMPCGSDLPGTGLIARAKIAIRNEKRKWSTQKTSWRQDYGSHGAGGGDSGFYIANYYVDGSGFRLAPMYRKVTVRRKNKKIFRYTDWGELAPLEPGHPYYPKSKQARAKYVKYAKTHGR
jgi:hypothetical protein